MLNNHVPKIIISEGSLGYRLMISSSMNEQEKEYRFRTEERVVMFTNPKKA